MRQRARQLPGVFGRCRANSLSFEDPAAVQGSEAERLAAYRRIQDQIHEKVRTFSTSRKG
jgi:hypothetical protein